MAPSTSSSGHPSSESLTLGAPGAAYPCAPVPLQLAEEQAGGAPCAALGCLHHAGNSPRWGNVIRGGRRRLSPLIRLCPGTTLCP